MLALKYFFGKTIYFIGILNVSKNKIFSKRLLNNFKSIKIYKKMVNFSFMQLIFH